MPIAPFYTPFGGMMSASECKLPRLTPQNGSLVAYPLSFSEPLTPPQQCDRQTLLEWRIGVQESITVGLLEKISLLKGEMLEQLKYAKQIERQQTNQRDALRQELQGLAENLVSINKEVQTFEENVRDKWKTVNAAAITLRNLENHHVSSLSDVRNRITRGDQAISTLAQKVNQIEDEIRALCDMHKRDVQEIHSHLKAHEQKNVELSTEIDRSSHQMNLAVQRTQDEFHKQLIDVERRLMNQVTETHQEIHTLSAQCLNERHRLENKLSDNMNSMFSALEHRIAEQKDDEAKLGDELVARMDETEKEVEQFKQQVLRTFKEVETRMNRMADEVCDNHRGTMDAIRDELRQGFATAHDTIQNMKSVLESKMRISEENLQLELGQLRKLVVLV
ncbi:Subfamily M23B non-peptidase ue (M23 family) [Paragonimus skrjabini miyazakii]|uniref:Subfamily M23B non-peptidase ue (M23 family) n=1 Tax=Paragonimus skrjabini miyazakii TaxID=59628 RepID=A0A8S9YV88_9TREM|nr:Subfamily M23B non-peptidase ue (M23 family) [Paragonimus skrjabini miyazakii]